MADRNVRPTKGGKMNDVDRLILEAWEKLGPRIMGDPEELARRLARRRMGILTRPVRAWCLAVRASDTRITPAHWGDLSRARDGSQPSRASLRTHRTRSDHSPACPAKILPPRPHRLLGRRSLRRLQKTRRVPRDTIGGAMGGDFHRKVRQGAGWQAWASSGAADSFVDNPRSVGIALLCAAGPVVGVAVGIFGG